MMHDAVKDVTVGVPMAAEIREELQKLATKHERTVAAEIRLAIRNHLEKEKSTA